MGKLTSIDLVRITSDEKMAMTACEVTGVGWIHHMSRSLGLLGRVIRCGGGSYDVDTGVAGQYHAWTSSCLTPVDWSPSKGETVRSTVDLGYLKGIMGCPVSDLKRSFIGPELRVVDGEVAPEDLCVTVQGPGLQCRWPVPCLVPLGLPEKKKRTLDDLLEALYDAQKEREDASELLAEYKQMTGEERPGFMG